MMKILGKAMAVGVFLIVNVATQSALANVCQTHQNQKSKHYDSISLKDCQAKSGVIRIQKNEKIGLVTPNGKIIVAPTYDYVSNLGNQDSDKLFVSRNGKWGVINTQGKVLIPIKYDFVSPIHNSPLYIVQKNDEPLIELQGMTIEEVDIVLSLLMFLKNMNVDSYAQMHKAKFGLLDGDDKLILPIEYDGIEEMDNDFITVKKDGKSLLIDKLGDVLKDD